MGVLSFLLTTSSSSLLIKLDMVTFTSRGVETLASALSSGSGSGSGTRSGRCSIFLGSRNSRDGQAPSNILSSMIFSRSSSVRGRPKGMP